MKHVANVMVYKIRYKNIERTDDFYHQFYNFISQLKIFLNSYSLFAVNCQS